MIPEASIAGIGLETYLWASGLLFLTGLIGVVMNKRSVVITLMAIEVMLLASAINLAVFAAHLGDQTGGVLILGLLAVVAAQAAIGVALVLTMQRNRGSTDVADINLLRG